MSEQYPDKDFCKAAPIMQNLRMIKSEIEIELIKKACEVTKKGFIKSLSIIKEGVFEYEIEAEVVGEFLRNASRGPGYQPIVASGADAWYTSLYKE